MKTMKNFIPILIIALATFLPLRFILAESPASGEAAKAAPSAAVAKNKPDSRGPINIKADHLEVDDKKKVAVLTGNVIVSWENFVMTSDKALALYKEVKVVKKSTGSGRSNPGSNTETEVHHEIVRIEADGNVKVTLDNRVALAGRAVYKASSHVVTLTGSPRIWRGEDFLSGEMITVYLDEDRSVVEGGADKKVNATFYRPEKKEDVVETEKNAGERKE